MEKILVQLNKKCLIAGLPKTSNLYFRHKGLGHIIIDCRSRQLVVLFNPAYIDVDTILAALLQDGYDIKYFYNIA